MFPYPRALRVRGSLKGFSVLEFLIAAVILGVVLSAVFITLSVGELSFTTTREKLELQSRLRAAKRWIEKDMRQAVIWNLVAPGNAPSDTHLKLNTWAWNSGTGTWDLSPDYIEYSYDAVNKRLRRSFIPETGTATIIDFNDVIEPPFYTTYIGPADPGNVFNADWLHNNPQLTIVIAGERAVRGGTTVPYRLQTEVRIRNGG